MSINGLHYSWSGWASVGGVIDHYCGDYLAKQRCLSPDWRIGEPDPDVAAPCEPGQRSCLDAMTSNSGEAWPSEVALEVCERLRYKVHDVIPVDLGDQHYPQERINFIVAGIEDFLNAIQEDPAGCVFL